MTSTVQFVGSENPNSNVCWRGSRPARWISTFLCGCLGLMVLGLAMTPLGAQTVRGHVVDPVLGVPVGGALVELLNGDTGRVVAAAISDEDGNYELSATSTGRYFVTARRIGHDSVQSDSFLLGSGETHVLELLAARAPIELPAFVATRGDGGCSSLTSLDADVSQVWAVARSGLVRADVTVRDLRLDFEIERYRQMRSEGGSLLYETIHDVEWVSSATPFVSLSPEVVERTGYVQDDGDGGLVWSGLDEEIMLSPSFDESHCFELISEGQDIGIEFRPKVPTGNFDVRGVIWVSRVLARLRSVDFFYVGPDGAEIPSSGGSLIFSHLPSGEVFVESWTVRAPRMNGVQEPGDDVASDPNAPSLRDYFEAHGKVLQYRRRGGIDVGASEHFNGWVGLNRVDQCFVL